MCDPIEERELTSIMKDQIAKDNRDNTEYNAICHKTLDDTLCGILRIAFIVATTVSFAYGSGLYNMLATDRRDTIFSLNFIGVEIGSDTEYYMNVVLGVSYFVYFLSGNVALEVFTILIENAIKTHTLLSAAKLKSFGKDLSAGRLNTIQKKEALINIIKEIDCCNNWVKQYNDHTYWRHFLPPFALTYSIGFGILCQYHARLCFFLL